MNKKIFIFTFSFFLCLSFLFSKNILAVDSSTIPEVVVKDSGIKAKFVSQTIKDPIEIVAGETVTVVYKFKNVGTVTWDNSSARYISAYTMEPRYKNSIFRSANWIEASQTAKMTPSKVAPGEFGEIKIDFSVPAGTKAGDYLEKFYLASRAYSWVGDGYFYAKIKVIEKKVEEIKNTETQNAFVFKNYLYLGARTEEVRQLQIKLKELGFFDHAVTGYFGPVTKEAVIAFQKANNLAPYPGWVGDGTRKVLNNIKKTDQINNSQSNTSDLIPPKEEIKTEEEKVNTGEEKAKLLMISKRDLKIGGGETVNLILGFQSLVDEDWQDYSFVITSKTVGDFSHNSWISKDIIIKKEKNIKKHETMKEKFSINTPAKKGSYILSVALAKDGEILEETITDINFEITKNASSNFKGSKYSVIEKVKEEIFSPRFPEPNIRVGVWRSPEKGEVHFRSNEDIFIVYKGEKEMGELAKNQLAKIYYKGGIYTYETDELYFSTSNFVRLVPKNNSRAVFELVNYDRNVSWKGPVNFNKYRGVFEYRTTEDGQNNYVINELTLEDYVAGIAETSNLSDIDYIEALLTAARTYAYYTMTHTDKHASRFFDVVAHTGDQLYLGYASEVLMPRVVEATRNTRGYMVTYDGEIVVTPYYANSDGRTRSWTEVWGGATKPWLVSVKAKYDVMYPKKMLGHGVGMSARDAAYMADREDVDFKDILKYYYTGVNVEKVYE